jgi:hypothetical protein
VQAREYTVAGQLEPFSLGDALALDKPVVILVLPDAAALEDLYAAQKSALGDACSDLYFEGLLDLDGTDQQKIDCGLQLSDPGYLDVVSSGSARTGGLYSSDTVKSGGASGQGENVGCWDLYMVSTRAESEQEMYSLNGGFLFLGIFLGILFMMGTVLIMYYKQVAEGYEDRARFQIMQQVGLPKPEIRRSINRQLLVVFFAPLLVAAVHVAFDYRLIVLLLTLFGLRNVSLTLLCTAGDAARLRRALRARLCDDRPRVLQDRQIAPAERKTPAKTFVFAGEFFSIRCRSRRSRPAPGRSRTPRPRDTPSPSRRPPAARAAPAASRPRGPPASPPPGRGTCRCR